jgi:hypothetical protein
MATSVKTIAATFAVIATYCLLISFGPSLLFRQWAVEIAADEAKTSGGIGASLVRAKDGGHHAVRDWLVETQAR